MLRMLGTLCLMLRGCRRAVAPAPLPSPHARCPATRPPPPATTGDANAGLKGLVKEHSAWLSSNSQRQLQNYRCACPTERATRLYAIRSNCNGMTAAWFAHCEPLVPCHPNSAPHRASRSRLTVPPRRPSCSPSPSQRVRGAARLGAWRDAGWAAQHWARRVGSGRGGSQVRGQPRGRAGSMRVGKCWPA